MPLPSPPPPTTDDSQFRDQEYEVQREVCTEPRITAQVSDREADLSLLNFFLTFFPWCFAASEFPQGPEGHLFPRNKDSYHSLCCDVKGRKSQPLKCHYGQVLKCNNNSIEERPLEPLQINTYWKPTTHEALCLAWWGIQQWNRAILCPWEHYDSSRREATHTSNKRKWKITCNITEM